MKKKFDEFKEKILKDLQRKMCFNDFQMVFISMSVNTRILYLERLL